MNLIIKHITLIFVTISFLSCDDPAPIEFTTSEEEDEVEISVINPDPNFVFTGYDSTGITNATPENESVITLSRIKKTVDNTTQYIGYGEAIFYDLKEPVLLRESKKIGYQTLKFGTVKFGNRQANRALHRLKYRLNNITKDTLVGIKHTIFYNKDQLTSQLDYPNEKSLKVEFISQDGKSSLMTIKVPEEIEGRIQTNGNISSGNFKITLIWNKMNSPLNNVIADISDEIIVGGIEKSGNVLVPLFRLNKFFQNRIEIPKFLVEDILKSQKYDYMVFTFIRKIRKSNSTSRLGDVYFASQSIHNIWIDI